MLYIISPEIIQVGKQNMAELNRDDQINFEKFIEFIAEASITVHPYPLDERAIQISVERFNLVVVLPLPDESARMKLSYRTPNFFMIQKSGEGFVRMLTENELKELLGKILSNNELQQKIKDATQAEGIKLEVDDKFVKYIRKLYIQKVESFFQSPNSGNRRENSPRFYSNGKH